MSYNSTALPRAIEWVKEKQEGASARGFVAVYPEFIPKGDSKKRFITGFSTDKLYVGKKLHGGYVVIFVNDDIQGEQTA